MSEGIQFPRDSKTSNPSAILGNQLAWASAIASVDQKESQKILDEKLWRQNYHLYVLKHVEISLQNPENALSIAKAGLEFCHNRFEFVRDGHITSFGEAMSTFTAPIFKTGFIKGSQNDNPPARRLNIPYKNEILTDDKILDLLTKWAINGTIEPSAKAAIELVVKNQQTWLDLSDKYFVLLGAGSAMGPYPILLKLGANVIAVDLDRKGVWEKLINVAKNSPGTLTFPLKVEQKGLTDEQIFENAGANLLTQTPEIRNWLLSLYPGKDLVVGSYAYLEGDVHVKISLAMDGIVKDLTTKRNAACAYLCSPNDDHAITVSSSEAQRQIFQNVGFPVSLIKNLLPSNYVLPVKPLGNHGLSIPLINGIIPEQGPSYALAKRIQHWRAIVARFSTGVIVSSNIAPSTSTPSVVSNPQFALAMKGVGYFKPMEVFEPNTSNAIMTALLFHDLRNKYGVSSPNVDVANPLLLFTDGAVHGGIWRLPFKLSSIFVPALLFALLDGWVGAVILLGVVGGVGIGMRQ